MNPPDPQTNLSGQVCMISGGLGAIGSATALELARRGADVSICDVHPAGRATELLAAIRLQRRNARYAMVDVADSQQVQCWVDQTEQELGVPTLIVPNAARVALMPIPELDPAEWHTELAVNLNGPFYLANAAARRMIATGRSGRIVFVGSWAAEHVHLQIPTYCVAKAGIRSLMKCMAGALAPHGILVSEISPGFVNAGLAAKWAESDAAAYEKSRRQIHTGQLVEPEEVAREIAHLCDPENRHMTGMTLLMDGGLSLFGSGVLRD